MRREEKRGEAERGEGKKMKRQNGSEERTGKGTKERGRQRDGHLAKMLSVLSMSATCLEERRQDDRRRTQRR